MKAIDITIFKLIESPFYKMIMGDVKSESGDEVIKELFADEETIYLFVYQFINPAKEIYRAY